MATSPTNLERELKAYERNRLVWAKSHHHKYVLVHGEDAVGFYDDYGMAFVAGLKKFGYGAAFLIKQVTPEEQICVIY